MVEKIEKFKTTKEQVSFAQKYKRAHQVEQYLKEKIGGLQKELMSMAQMLQQVQGGMKFMADNAPINRQEKLDGQDDSAGGGQKSVREVTMRRLGAPGPGGE